MGTVDTLEGVLNQALWYHYDVGNDVLYLRLVSKRMADSYGEETDDGFILLKEVQTDALVGMTIVSWWKRFGHGNLPDSISEIQRQIEPFARRLAA
jgi:hypothetical protein